MKKWISLILVLCLVLSLAACGSKEEKAAPVDMKALYDSFASQMPDMFYPDEATLLSFLGISTDDCKQLQVAICAEGMRCDEIWLIEAKDQAALDNLKQLAQTRIAAKMDETISYAPDQYAVAEKAQVVTKGLNLALIISPEVDALKASVEAAFH